MMLLSSLVGFAHREESMHWVEIWAYNIGFGLIQCVGDM